MKTNSITLTQALQGYQLHLDARALSPHTIADYHNTYRLLQQHLDPHTPVDQITTHHIQTFLAHHANRVSRKTLNNYHIGLSALWTWMIHTGLVETHIIRQIPRPQPPPPDIQPYTDTDIHAILNAIGRSKPTRTDATSRVSPTTRALKHPDRHRAIIYLLLDTGMRASELCRLTLADLDLKNRTIHLLGKGGKHRHVPISPRTAQILWKYITLHRADARLNQPLIITANNRPIKRRMLHERITNICKRAGVKGATLHRFRHTFAINYLRNGGNLYALQQILGHTRLDMVKHYLAIAQADIDNDHNHASPVSNLGI